MKKAETQEQEFLEVCSSYDHDLLTGKKEMTLKDYERITYLVSSLGYSQYLQFLIGKYMDLAQADEEREEREHEIYLEYPEYYEDEGILEEEKWLEEFLNQLPEKKREYFEKLIKESYLYMSKYHFDRTYLKSFSNLLQYEQEAHAGQTA